MSLNKTELRRLECNYLPSPCGIAPEPPVFSWCGPAGRLQIYDDNGLEQYDSQIPAASPFRPPWTPRPRQRYRWKLTAEDQTVSESVFETALAEDCDWLPARWIYDKNNSRALQAPSSIFTARFEMPKIDKNCRVRLYIGALGVYTVKLNGEYITDRVLAPGAVDFASRVIYQTYPVERFLNSRSNVISVELAGGWHSGAIARVGDNYADFFYTEPDALILRLELIRDDGTFELLLASDEQWRVSHLPIRCSDIYMGEKFDAALDPASVLEFPASEIPIALTLDPRNGPPVRRICELEPVAITQKADGAIVDFGQNFAGREKISFTAPRGTEITIRHGEMLDSDGSVYTENLRSARAETIIIAPGGKFTYEPEMTFYGFRYLEVCGISEFTVKGVVLYSDMIETSRFECSNLLLNKFMENVFWSQRGNFLDIPTDCPQRDERRGWTGDAQVFAQTALYNMHAMSFFRKYLNDVRRCAAWDGRFPMFVPAYPGADLQKSTGISGWAEAGVRIPYLLYLFYGDREVLRENADTAYRWIDYQAEHSKNGLCCHARFLDWLNMDSVTSEEYISTAYFAYGAKMCRQIAETLGDISAGERMQRHWMMAKTAFKRHFLVDGVLREKTQCAAAMALMFELLDGEEKTAAVKVLTDALRERDGLLSTGFLGTPLLLHALSSNGELDLAYRLLEETRCPSWLFPVTQGATTIWERWNSWTEQDGFGDVEMNSFNHYSYGAAADWVYQVAAGIVPEWEHPGFREFGLAPRPGGSLTHLKMQFDSPAGLISSGWRRDNVEIIYNFTVPDGTRAHLSLPGENTTLLLPGNYEFIRKNSAF